MASKVFYRDFYGDIEKDAFLNLNNKYQRWLNIATHPLQVFITVLIILTCSQFLGKVDDIPTKETRGRELTKNFLLLSNLSTTFDKLAASGQFALHFHSDPNEI